MDYILLMTIVLGVTLQQIASKMYGEKVKGGTYTFTMGTILVALLFFVITSGGKFVFSSSYIWYSVLFAISTSVTLIFTLLAINEGPLSLSSLITQYSLLIPTAYGLIALDEPIGASLIIGVIFLMVSLVLINIEKKGEEKKITLKWAIYIFLAFVGNGACSTVQKVQQISCAGQYKNEFMIVAYAMSVLVLALFMLRFERKQCMQDMKQGVGYIIVRGLGLAVVNFLVLVLSNTMPASVMFPIISAGGIVVTFLVALFIYKEKLSLLQNAGLILGIISIVFLNI